VTSNSARCLFAWLLAAVLVFRGGNAIRESFQTRNWQPIHALVTESDARWVEHRLPVRRSMWSYELHLRFVYTIKRRVFTGARASFSAWGPNENLNPFNSAIAHRFPEGTQVIAHYDPLDPSRSVLQPAARPSAWLALALGLLAARLGLVYSRRVTAERQIGRGDSARNRVGGVRGELDAGTGSHSLEVRIEKPETGKGRL
jgi:hypothetical protein